MPAEAPRRAKRRLPTIKIGHISITLLPGETLERLNEITAQVVQRWQPANIVEEFDCDMIIHARFKIERYRRFRDHFIASGIEPDDLDRAIKSYQATIQTAEKSLTIARENVQARSTVLPPRIQPKSVTADMLADMPVDTPLQ